MDDVSDWLVARYARKGILGPHDDVALLACEVERRRAEVKELKAEIEQLREKLDRYLVPRLVVPSRPSPNF